VQCQELAVNRRLRSVALLLPLLAGLAGCATQPPQPPPPSARDLDSLTTGGPRVVETVPAPAPLEPARPLSPLDDPNSPLFNKIIYFDYDTAEIPQDATPLLRAHANYLFNTPGASVTLAGHTDERGTRDYNLALGDRRAHAVQRFMIAEGVPSEKLSRVSYGEERPAEPGSSERAWAKNRRVELVY
jgi:peptidoglycan-associated lipoprotein